MKQAFYDILIGLLMWAIITFIILSFSRCDGTSVQQHVNVAEWVYLDIRSAEDSTVSVLQDSFLVDDNKIYLTIDCPPFPDYVPCDTTIINKIIEVIDTVYTGIKLDSSVIGLMVKWSYQDTLDATFEIVVAGLDTIVRVPVNSIYFPDGITNYSYRVDLPIVLGKFTDTDGKTYQTFQIDVVAVRYYGTQEIYGPPTPPIYIRQEVKE